MKFILMMNRPGKVPHQINCWKPAELAAHIAFMKRFAKKLNESGELGGGRGPRRARPGELSRIATAGQAIRARGRPLRTYETIVDLIANTTNRGGHVVRARLDRRRYPIGKRVSAKELRALRIERHDFHGDWNYVIRPPKHG